MEIAAEDIEKIAHLARIGMPDQQKIKKFAGDLTNILKLADQITQIPTDHIEPMAHPVALAQRLRPDVVSEHDQRALLQSIAPHTEAGLYIVPAVMEQEG